MMYILVDIHTKQQVGKVYNDLSRARKAKDRKDLAYGAYRYVVKSLIQEN